MHIFHVTELFLKVNANTKLIIADKICVPEGAKNACLQMVSEGAKQNVQMTCIIGRDR